jgi:hypothetical protein
MEPNTIVSNCVKQCVRGKLFLSMRCKIDFTVPSCLTEIRFCKTGLYGIQTFVINGGFFVETTWINRTSYLGMGTGQPRVASMPNVPNMTCPLDLG